MSLKKPTKPQTLLEWFWAAGIVFGALIAGGVILRNMGSIAYSAAIAPVADSLRVERDARMRADAAIQNNQQLILSEVTQIHTLLVRRNGRGDR